MKAKNGTTILLFDELRNIKNGTYKNLIIECREALNNGDEKLYGDLKTKLPAVTFCGEFHTIRKASQVSVYNNLMILDIDHISIDELSNIKEFLIADKYILSFWDSPSGKGIKCLVRINNHYEKHRAVFNSLTKYFFEKYQIELDPSGKDISRLCFSSWDENLFYNPYSEIYLDFIEDIKLKNSDKSNSSTINISLLKSAFATEGLNKSENKDIIRQIIKYLNKRNLSITETHDNWLKVSFAIASSFSYDVGEKYFLSLCRLDQTKHNEEKSINLLKSSYNSRKTNPENSISFATIVFFAKTKGFKI